MQAPDFFREQEDVEWDFKGIDPWSRMETVFDAERVELLRQDSLEGIPDLEAAYGIAQLAYDELLEYGTSGHQRLDDDQMALVLRTLRTVLKRLEIKFDPPFRNFKGFHGYWSKHDMGGSWAARRGYLSDLFSFVFSQLDQVEDRQTPGSVRGVDGELKNIIFASTGPKPRIVLRDAINNVIEVVENGQYCLVYDRPLSEAGLSWLELVDWWKQVNAGSGAADLVAARNLYRRLAESLTSPPEKHLFRVYCERLSSQEAGKLPALLPQVYLHYDPRTRRERDGAVSVLRRERMDFLLFLPKGVRIVLEVDGKQHYAEGDTASPRLYSEMVQEDRRLRLLGYEVYRFGGHELTQPDAGSMLRKFFDELLQRHVANSSVGSA